MARPLDAPGRHAARAGEAARAPLPAGARPLSAAQLLIWHAETLRRGTPRWTQEGVTTLDGPVDRSRLEGALASAVAAHPALRTCVLRRGRTAWQVFHDAAGFAVGWHDFSALPAQTREQRVGEFLAAAERHCFRLYDGWLFSADVLVCTPDRALLVLLLHHIAADGMSFPLILRHVASAYRGEAAAAEPDPAYERWLDRQARPDLNPALGRALEFYRGELAGAPRWHESLYDSDAAGVPREPPDLPRSTRLLEPALVAGLSRLAERTAATLFIVCLAAYGAALAEALDAPDLVVGVYVSGRGGEAGLVAMAVNLVLVRLRLDPAADADTLIRAVKEAWRPVRRFEAAPIHDLRQLARGEAPPAPSTSTPATSISGADGPAEPGVIPERVQLAINFLDLRNTVCDLPGVASRTTHPQSAFPLNDLLLLLFREQNGLRLRLINGSGTPRLSAARLDGLLGTLDALLRRWGATPEPGPVPPALE